MNSIEKTANPDHINVDPDFGHFMGIHMTVPAMSTRTTFLFDKNPVKYILNETTKPGKSRILTMLGGRALLDGEISTSCTCHYSNKILARFGSTELALQLFPGQAGGSGLIRTIGNDGTPGPGTPILAFISQALVASVDVQKADQTWIENWATIVVSSDESGQPVSSMVMSGNPAEKIPVAVTGGQNDPLGFQIFLGSAVTSNGGYLEGILSVSDGGLQGKMYLQTNNPAYDPDQQGSLKFNYTEVSARARWESNTLTENEVLSLQNKPGAVSENIDLNHPEALWRTLATDTDMSVGELIGMTAPDNNDLHKAVCDGMMNCAFLAADPGWLKDLKIESPAALPELTAIASDPANKDFFQRYFKAMGCSELAVVQMEEGWKSFTNGWQTVQSRMHYFWQGGASGCLAMDKDFLRISEAVAQIYFSKMMRTFQRYLNLPLTERTKWASDLLDAVTTPQMLMRLTSSKECEAIHKYIIMLNALDKDGGFDKLFTKRINGAIQTQVAKRAGSADFKSVEDFLTRVLKVLVDPQSELTGTVFEQLLKDLNDLRDNDGSKWVAFAGSMKELAVELTNLALAYKNVPWQQKLQVWKQRILQRYGGDERMVRIYSECGTLALTAVTVGFTTFALVGEIKEWSNLTDLQKTATVLGAIQQVGSLADQIYKFVKFIREPSEPVSTEMDLFSWSGNWDVLPEDAIGSEAYELRLAANTQTVLKYDFAAFAGPLEALTVVVTVLSMVSLGFQINDDINENEPTAVIVFDILEEVAMFASILVLPAMAANPILGAVVAVVGIIISIIDSLLPRNPPPVIIWAENIGTPFVESIPDPPAGWEDKANNLNLAVIVRKLNPRNNGQLPWPVRRIVPGQFSVLSLPPAQSPFAETIRLLSTWNDLPEDQKRVVAESIWKAIQSVKGVSNSTIADCLIEQVAKSKSAGPVFFFENNPQNIVNGRDYTADFTDIGIWVMGYAISGNQYFKNVNANACMSNMIPAFQNKVLAKDLFLDHLYKTGGFDAFLKYSEPETKIAVLDLILSPGFIPEAFWQHSENLFPCQVLLLVASDLGCDLTVVRQTIKEWNINPAVFDMADGTYNFFENFITLPQANFFDYINSNQNIQNGLASNRPNPAGVNLCNVLSFEVWADVYQSGGGFGVYDFYQNYNGVYGDPVDKWVQATKDLPHSGPSTNLRHMGNSFLGSGSGDPGSYPAGAHVSPDEIHSPSCFPADAEVILSTRKRVPIAVLKHGDHVLTVNKKGQHRFSEVFFFGHRDNNIAARYRKIKLQDGKSLRLSNSHYIPVADTLSWEGRRFVTASGVKTGNFVWVAPDDPFNGNPQPSLVVSAEDCESTGMFNPYTLDDSIIIVDNVAASVHSDWFLEDVVPDSFKRYIPGIYDLCLIPGKLIYRMLGSKWAETLQNEVQIDKAAYGETGIKALLKPYLILSGKVLKSILKNIGLHLKMISLPLLRHSVKIGSFGYNPDFEKVDQH